MRRRRQAGYTFIEMMVATAIFAGLFAAFARAFTTSQALSSDSTALVKASEELRRNLDAIANCWRGAAYASLTGFAADGTSTTPTFQCVSGGDAGGKVLAAAQQMKWQSSATPVKGIASPGDVVTIQGGVTKLVAARVPSGGFKAILSGSTLKIQLTTYYATSLGKTASVSGECSVSLRN